MSSSIVSAVKSPSSNLLSIALKVSAKEKSAPRDASPGIATSSTSTALPVRDLDFEALIEKIENGIDKEKSAP